MLWFIIFVVSMLLWLLGCFYEPAPPNARYVGIGRGLVAWIAVVSLAMMTHTLHP